MCFPLFVSFYMQQIIIIFPQGRFELFKFVGTFSHLHQISYV